ncbi:hypothetical protein COCC4DRAFT_59996 [Bipolaris maydis ATCC 48331]|uniref:Probable double zinc ribbon domain-containing protein n=2 Tax=Cochliobolus heterostrophus TaxID=5016 RepID=M2TXE2_COCH5|nr:uncharacterized protein COCC4DRAFT_59996 [Bipolaris maydis ATCC 48331]EMD91189.1 hypothetical protein COCHEDRAFT_1156522 [Bipolaris maydis C5]KAH7560280.1 hypothetical protein BM1_03914 [Bipolaris maydis]ENI05730.1 hypothetical protein COCC4DRAFT_59996 [Bipolaris maydis ATCC 48331]KAJ5022885.1 hypothetical protein J3E73DRAFT_374180 [Bipolaris maydis]KAJ5064429.1 hypothetical protein J3E74DRAFT_402885 [Bipolaris maydis]
MNPDDSLRGRLRQLFGLPSKLEATKSAVLDDQRCSGDRVGTWRCLCGHLNTILHLAGRNTHPLGLLQCRGCPLVWHPNITPTFTSQRLNITSQTIVSNAANDTRIVSRPRNPASQHIYVCLGHGCGLSWRTDIKREWLSGNKRHILLLGGKRGKLHCDCGMKIFEPGEYEIFEIEERFDDRLAASAALGAGGGEKRRGEDQ